MLRLTAEASGRAREGSKWRGKGAEGEVGERGQWEEMVKILDGS